MKLTTIQKQLQELSALPYPTETKLGGTTYRLCGGNPKAKFTAVRPERNTLTADPHAQAIRLYGTEKNAAEIIRRHIDTLGADLDPDTLKRADRFCSGLERGHTVVTQHETTTQTVCRRGRYIKVEQATGVVLGYKASMPFAELAAAELGRQTRGYGYGQWLTLTLDELEKLQQKFNFTIV